MAQAKHIGKVVVTLDEKEFPVAPPSERPVTFRSDGTYLLTGGLGGLGLVLAQWMVERGARHLVLVGRSGATSAAAQDALAAMHERGASVVVARANVADEQDVARVIRRSRTDDAAVERCHPPRCSPGRWHPASIESGTVQDA